MVFSSNTVRSEILLRTKYYKDLTILQCVGTVSVNGSSVESFNMKQAVWHRVVIHGKLPCPAWTSSWKLRKQAMVTLCVIFHTSGTVDIYIHSPIYI